jgi:glutamate-1-semialdehyde 2,1-aminomutase
MKHEKSRILFGEAQRLFPGGVNSPVRAHRAVGGDPLFAERGEGAWIVDVDGNAFVDYTLSWGPLILGHAPGKVVDAIAAAARHGTSFGMPGPMENELAERIIRVFPSLEMLRFVNSGTEATMSALRVARAFTGRSKVVKFAGCYHGHADAFLVQAGSGAATLGIPDSPGVSPASAQDTLVASFNALDEVEALFARHGDQIAAVIVEPVAGNMGVVPPLPGFLEGLRHLTARFGALLIFDEVMTGFRVHPAGAQVLFGVTPDLTTLGKVIGGGLPVGAYGGRRDIMQLVAPAGPVYQAGTLAGNPLAMAAGIATLEALEHPGIWSRAERAAARLEAGIARQAREHGIVAHVQRVGTMLTVFFGEGPVTDWTSASLADRDQFARVFRCLLDAGVNWVPSQFEAAFLSTAHGNRELELTLDAFGEAFGSRSAESPIPLAREGLT